MADDPELARWRAQRLAQMQGAAGGARSAQEAEQMRKKEEEMAEQRRLMLKQILSDAASERLNNVRLVKPDKATQVESYIINLAQSGRLTGRLSGEQLKDLLHQVAEQTDTKTKVTISRRRQAFDDEDDDDDEDF